MREKLAVKSSIIGIISKITTIAISLIVARFFMRNLGIEISGINGVFSNVIGFLQLAELGIGSAIIYALYRPLVEHNIEEIKSLMLYYKRIYRYIGLIVICLGLALSPFVSVFIKDTTYARSYITIVFLIQVASSASTYFLAYKRNLMYADQRQYVSTLIDAIVNILSGIIRVVIIVTLHSYILYLIVQVCQNVISNLCVNGWCNRQYPYLLDKNISKYNKVDELVSNVKNLTVGKIGGWVYNSTDNLIISSFVGVNIVGLMSSYYTLNNMIKLIVGAVVQPIQPMIGQFIVEQKDIKKSYQLFMSYTFIRYCIAAFVTVGFIVMANPVVKVWIGEEFVISRTLIVLIAIDMYISIVHGPTGEYINALGLFRSDRNMSLWGMIINLVSSLVLVNFWGAAGVLIGTVIAQCYYWIFRGTVVYKQYFRLAPLEYIMKVCKYTITVIITIAFIDKIYEQGNLLVGGICELFLKGIITVTVTGLMIVLFNFTTDEFKYACGLVQRTLFRKVKR